MTVDDVGDWMTAEVRERKRERKVSAVVMTMATLPPCPRWPTTWPGSGERGRRRKPTRTRTRWCRGGDASGQKCPPPPESAFVSGGG